MSISPAKLLPLLANLGTYFKAGADHYATLHESGATTSPDVLAMFIYAKMSDWNPKMNGKFVLDAGTKEATARMLAGLIINLTAIGA